MRLKKVEINGQIYYQEVGKDEREDGACYFNASLDEDNATKDAIKMSKLMSMLPFLDDDEVAEIAHYVVSGNPNYKNIKLSALFPFMDEDDCDDIFDSLLDSTQEASENLIYSVLPFVSEEVLSKLVDKFIEGKYQNLDVNKIFPFMSDDDIKRLFKYELNKESR